MMIIDAHVYCLPKILTDNSFAFPVSEKIIIDSIHHHPEGEFALSLSTPEMILQSMTKSGIAKSVLVSFPWNSSQLCSMNNSYLKEVVKSHPIFLMIASVNPLHDGWKEEASNAKATGAIGLKVNPEWQGFDLDDPCMDELAKFAISKNLFLMIHIDHSFKKSRTSSAHFCEFLQKNPEVKVIAAHMGGMVGMYALNDRLRNLFKNVWFDTAVSSTLSMIKHYTQVGLEDKIIFGSDFPFNHSHEQKQVVEGIKLLGLGQEIEDKIFSKNFNRLIEDK